METLGDSVGTRDASLKSDLAVLEPGHDEDDDEQFVYPGAPVSEVKSVEIQEETRRTTQEDVQQGVQENVLRPSLPPSPAQLESLYAAAISGDLILLKHLFQNALINGEVEPFSLANNASSRTGFTALHAAASRGYLDIVTWLIEDCGAMPDLEDREGETALHKAALNGHLSVIRYLLPDRADVHARDADGWTALHNACSKGYLGIVRWLCETGGATSLSDGVRGIDIRSKDGWTPLMNAASKGHHPVVLYLLWKQGADPLVRNKWGETAYDAAAAVFEVWICEMLQQAEAEKWRGATIPYNPLAVHTTVPLIVYENQRLDTRLKTLAVSGGRPKFSASGLGRHARRPPFELKLLTTDIETGVRELAAWRSDVQLPLRVTPWALPKPESQSRTHDGAERSHFWLSDWTLDVTHPGVDAEEGWQYAHFFSDPDDQWTADQPPQLGRILSGSNLVGTGFGDSSGRRSSNGSSRPPQTWVRRRRWVRIMRRRLDIPPLPFLEPDGSMYHLDDDGSLIPFVEDNGGSEGEGQELDAMPSTFLSSAQDYVSRARYLVGNQSQYMDNNGPSLSAVEVRRAIAKLERATMELRQGILADDDADRKTQAEVLLNAYSRELDRRRLAAGAQGLLLSGNDDTLEQEEEDDDDDEFHYSGATISETPSSRAPTDLTPQLSQAPDFRVPTREAPQKIITSRLTIPTPHQLDPQWERDEAVSNCRDCQRRFNFLLRRHCRKCGRIFCDRCSSHRLLLDPSDIIHDPAFPESQTSASLQRVCQNCFEQANAGVPSRLLGGRDTSMERIFVDQAHLTIPGRLTRRQSSSQLSDLAECPVCNRNLDEFRSAEEQEFHVKACLEGGSGTPQSAKYLVYNLPGGSALLGEECVICLEEFVKGSTVARLSCFCSFHNTCLSSWLQRGKSCPVHTR
ncbi:Putative E3 ubiquitin-protein ligase C36B7.05c [Termitomyces sp. J132]|nr:Putative E3 ubiquitin-protein ligase C36B7.05c [Termitomyces sp. J132]